MLPNSLIYLVLLLASGGAFTDDGLRVCASGCDYNTIREAIEAANPGDRIVIQSGTYFETNLLINKPLTLEGIGYPVIDAQDGDEVLIIRSDSVTVSGLDIRNIGTSYVKDRAAIRIERSSHVTIEHNKLYNTFFGIYTAYTKNSVIRHNTIEGFAVSEAAGANAIHMWYCDSMYVHHNTTSGHRDGIYLEFVGNSTIEHNISRNHLRYGLHFMFSNHDAYRFNTFERNGAGVAVMYSTHIIMEDNRFANNWGPISYGLLLKDIRDCHMERNVFYRNTVGIYAEGSVRKTIHNNTFEQNGSAVRVMANCEDVVFTANNFIGNTFEVATNSKRNFNTFDGNYWSGYRGYDLDRDGIGDVPYRPVRLFSYLVEQIPPSVILMRSPFVGLLEHAEQVVPTFTPATLMDERPLMKPVRW